MPKGISMEDLGTSPSTKGMLKGMSMEDLTSAASKGDSHFIRTVISYLAKGCRHDSYHDDDRRKSAGRNGRKVRWKGAGHPAGKGAGRHDPTAAFTALAGIAEGGDPHAIAALAPFVAMSTILHSYF